MYNQKEIVLFTFPYTDLSGAKQRPALIISNNTLNKTEDRICCLITSNSPKDGIVIGKKDFEQGKLPFKSWIKPHRLFTVHEKLIKKKLCTLNNSFYDAVIEKVNHCVKRK